jgi:hypothetical protein
MFKEAKQITGKEPETIISDGAFNIAMAITDEMPTSNHGAEIRMAGKIHSNKMERMNDEIRDREKTFRGLKAENTPILKGNQIFHNFIREHESLEGKAPA